MVGIMLDDTIQGTTILPNLDVSHSWSLPSPPGSVLEAAWDTAALFQTRASQVRRIGGGCRLRPTPVAAPHSWLPFQLDPEPATETLTAFGGLPRVAQTYRSLGLPQSVSRHLRLKQRQRGLDEATMVESFVLLNAAGGDCLEDVRRLAEDPGLPTVLGHARPLPDAARKFL